MIFPRSDSDGRGDELRSLLTDARKRWDSMSPAERAAMIAKQRRSYARGEAAFGSDRQEAEFREALQSGDPARIAQCEAAEAERLAQFDATWPEGEAAPL